MKEENTISYGTHKHSIIQSKSVLRFSVTHKIFYLCHARGIKELLDDAVAEVIAKLVSNPKFAAMIQEKINTKVDTAAIDQEIGNYEKHEGAKGCSLIKPVNGQNKFSHNVGRMGYGEIFIL